MDGIERLADQVKQQGAEQTREAEAHKEASAELERLERQRLELHDRIQASEQEHEVLSRLLRAADAAYDVLVAADQVEAP
jgi:hypothetical protein